MRKKLLKESKIFKNYFGPVLRGIAILCVSATVLAGCASQQPQTPQNEIGTQYTETVIYSAQSRHMPTKEQAESRLAEIYNTKDERFLLGQEYENLFRLPCPKEGESIKINFLWDCSEADRIAFLYTIEHYNQVFSLINPHYYFEANFNPTEQDKLDPYSINVSHEIEFFEDTTAVGYECPGSVVQNEKDYGYDLLENEIILKSSCINRKHSSGITFLTTIFIHEIGHVLGLGDAYKNKSATKDTIMQDSSYRIVRLGEIDIATLDALYHDPENKLSYQDISNSLKQQFAEEENTIENMAKQYFFAKSEKLLKKIADDIKAYSQDGLSPTDYLKSCILDSRIPSESKTELFALIGDELKYNEKIDSGKFFHMDCEEETFNFLDTEELYEKDKTESGQTIDYSALKIDSFIASFNDIEILTSLEVYFQLGDYLIGWPITIWSTDRELYRINPPDLILKRTDFSLDECINFAKFNYEHTFYEYTFSK